MSPARLGRNSDLAYYKVVEEPDSEKSWIAKVEQAKLYYKRVLDTVKVAFSARQWWRDQLGQVGHRKCYQNSE